MARKKILWLCSWYPGKTEPFNGDFIQRHAQAASLCNDIYVIHVIGDTSGKVQETVTEIKETNGLTEHLIYYKKSVSLMGRFRSYYKWMRLCKEAIQNYTGKYGKPDLIHVHVPMRMGTMALWAKAKFNIPFIVSEHWGIYNEIEKLNYSARSRSFKNTTRKIFSEAKQFISVSRFLAECINQLVIKIPYTVIPNVVNTGYFFQRDEALAPAFRFIHVSNMVPIKNAEGLLHAFKTFLQKNPATELIMVGDKDPAIRHLSSELDLDNQVHFKGEIPYAEVAKEMRSANCLLLYSNMENSPCVIGEALCCGIPIVATNVGGIPELVDESNSMLIEPGNEPMLLSAMEAIVTSYSKYEPQKISEAARKKFSFQTVAKEFDSIYEMSAL